MTSELFGAFPHDIAFGVCEGDLKIGTMYDYDRSGIEMRDKILHDLRARHLLSFFYGDFGTGWHRGWHEITERYQGREYGRLNWISLSIKVWVSIGGMLIIKDCYLDSYLCEVCKARCDVVS